MDESDSDSSVERMFTKYSKKFKEDFTTNSVSKEPERSPSINININMPSTSGTTSVSLQLASGSSAPINEKKTAKKAKKIKKNTKRKRWIDTTVGDWVNKSDPDYVPARNYIKMSSKELNNIAARVRIYHETGVVLSDEEDVAPCKSKNIEQKQTGPKRQLEKIPSDRYGKGEVGKGWSSYAVRRCTCCNLRKDRCVSNLLSQGAVNTTGLSNHDYSNIMQRLSEGAINRFKKREGRLLQIQQRQLLQHPEIADLFDNDEEATPPPVVLSQDKRQWIQRFIDSMTPDRIDYEKPQQKTIVQGITHTPPDNESNYLQQVLDKHADCLDAKTIVQRVDFQKERDRQSRLIQTTLDAHFKSIMMASASTPKFNSTELGQSAEMTPSQSVLEVADLSPIKKDELGTAGPFDISGIAAIEQESSAPVNIKDNLLNAQPELVTTTENNVELDNETVDYNDGNICTDFSHLDRSNITIRAPKTIQELRPGLDSNMQNRPRIHADNKTNGAEDNIMSFVNDLLAGQEESIHKEVEERCERLLENTRKTRDVLNNAINEYVVVDDIFENEHEDLLDNSVQIIEDLILDPCSNNEVVAEISDTNSDVCVVDGPSTSRITRRTGRRNRRAAQLTTNRKRSRRKPENVSQPTVLTVSTSSSSSVLPLEPSANTMQVAETPENVAKQQSSRALRDCPICLEPFTNKEISSTICGHVFCTTCIVAAVKAQRACPNCRKGLTLKKIHPLFI